MNQVHVDVVALAKLARLEVSEEELSKLAKEIPSILSFVDAIQKVSADIVRTDPSLRNVLRDDTEPHESGIYSDDLLKAAPASRDDQVVVKQVISRKK